MTDLIQKTTEFMKVNGLKEIILTTNSYETVKIVIGKNDVVSTDTKYTKSSLISFN